LDGSLAMDYLISLQASPWENRFPDVIFLDLNMSQMDGWDFLEEYEKVYAKDHPESRILVLTSSLNPEDRKKVMNYPFVLDFISKPISVNLLAQIKQNQFFAARFD
jgi:CheY-like chemotaxis protein